MKKRGLFSCHDFIMAFPDGYDTVIGEGGATLSGGEKQRIAIARAIMKDAPIIILDEATANVDPENEKELTEAIGNLTKQKTTAETTIEGLGVTLNIMSDQALFFCSS